MTDAREPGDATAAADRAPADRAPVDPAPAVLAPADHAPVGGTRLVLGDEPGVASLTGVAPGRRRPLVTGASVLPELVDVPGRPRRLWRHPAFVVSAVLTLLALVAAAVLLVLSLTGDGPARVTGLELGVDQGNAVLSWTGDEDAALYVVDGSEAQDLTQLVRGEQAWVPVALGLFGEDSCFVVRPATVEEPVTLTADGLAEQGGASACVADVDS